MSILAGDTVIDLVASGRRYCDRMEWFGGHGHIGGWWCESFACILADLDNVVAKVLSRENQERSGAGFVCEVQSYV